MFQKKIDVRWADVDQNRHVRHSAYYDYGAHARMSFFAEKGFKPKSMLQLGIGPILFKEECTFIKELKLGETVTVNLLKGDMLPDGSRWSLHHEIFNTKGEKSAHITIKGAWIDLKLRKLAIPPKELVEVMINLDQGEAYEYGKS